MKYGKPLAAVAVILSIMGGVSAYVLWPSGHVIRGMKLAGKSVENLSVDEVKKMVAKETEKKTPVITIIDTKGKTVNVPLEELGIQIDEIGTATNLMNHGYEGDVYTYVKHRVEALIQGYDMPFTYRLNGPVAETFLMKYNQDMGTSGTNATLTLEGDKVIRHSAKVGRQLDMAATLQRLREQVQQGQVQTLELVINESAQPSITDRDLSQITSVLGSYTTYFDPSNTNRAHNIHLAGQKIHQTLIPPGGVFSFNDVVGERTAEAGYDDAPVFMGGRLVPGIGGGICQISSTLFNTALLAGMDIVERDTHFAPVSYIPVGLDATVAWGYIDFQFKNPFNHSIYVITEEGVGSVTITILGAASDVPKSVSLHTKNEKKIPNKTITKEDATATEDVVEESGHEGISIDTVRTITYGDGRTDTYTFNSYYEPVDRVIVKGLQKQEKSKVEPSSKPEKQR